MAMSQENTTAGRSALNRFLSSLWLDVAYCFVLTFGSVWSIRHGTPGAVGLIACSMLVMWTMWFIVGLYHRVLRQFGDHTQ